MVKPNLLVVCSPDHYLLRNLIPIQDQAVIHVGASPDTVLPFVAEAEIVLYSGLTGKGISLAEMWPHMHKVRWVHSLSAGLEKVLFPKLIESSVPVTNARGVFKRSLAEFAIVGMLYFYKRVRHLVDSQRERRWTDFNVDWLPGKVMGVVGFGQIGRECAQLAKSLGLTIFATRRNPGKSAQDPIVDRAFPLTGLNEMLAQTDVLVVAAPLTPETHHMISDAQFAVMKENAIVINIGRGPVIDEAALVRALELRRIQGAALDVFEIEPLPQDSPLWGMDNVLVSPHCTDRTSDPDWLDLSMTLFVENFHRYVAGEALQNIADKRAGY